MPGIASINNRIDKASSGDAAGFYGQELFLNDGDQALVAVVASGHDDDDTADLIDDFYRHSYSSTNPDGSTKWNYTFCQKSVDTACSLCDEGLNPQFRFGFWSYVYYVLHKNPHSQGEWTEVNFANQTYYKQDVEDFRIISLPFGRNEMIWNQFISVYFEQGAMDKMVMRVKRDGGGRDTTWTISVTSKKTELDGDVTGRVKDLSGVKEYYQDIFNRRNAASNGSDTASATDNTVDLIEDVKTEESKKSPSAKTKAKSEETSDTDSMIDNAVEEIFKDDDDLF